MKKIKTSMDESHKSVLDNDFTEIFKGGQIDSSIIELKKYEWVEGQMVSPPQLYRKYFYNKEGKVIKKLGFDENSDLEFKEENVFTDGLLKVKLITTNEGVWRETYDHNDKKQLIKYQFLQITIDAQNPDQSLYEYDRYGRKSIKKSYARSGFLEYTTEYVYPDTKSKNYSFRSVTDANGNLVVTYIYAYNKEGKLIRLAENKMHYKDYMKLDDAEKDEVLKQSDVISHYVYKENGFISKYIRTIPKGQLLDVTSAFLGTGDYVITQERDYNYGIFNKRPYPITILDFDPRYREPNKVQVYKYFDKNNKQVFPKPVD